jgi:hypothetical protein
MSQKSAILKQLVVEQEQLVKRRDLLLAELETARNDYNEEFIDTSIEDLLLKIQTTVDQLFGLENVIYELRIQKTNKVDLGQLIKVGDCVTLKGDKSAKSYYITTDSQYVNPELGVISETTPLAQKLLEKKYGELININLGGIDLTYRLIP